MLKILRKHSKHWLIAAIIGAIVVVFIFWGIGGMEQPQSRELARVYGNPIPLTAYYQYATLLEKKARFRRNLSEEDVKALREQAPDNLIRLMLLVEKARRLGLSVSDSEVQTAILRDPDFQEQGAFDPRLYEMFIGRGRNRQAEKVAYEKWLRQQILAAKALENIAAFAKVSELELQEYFRLGREAVQVDYVEINPEAFAARVKPTDAELRDYYDKHQAQLRVAEKVKVRYVLLRVEDFRQQVEISPKEMEDYLKENRAELERPKVIRAREIFLALDPTAKGDQRQQVEQKAETLLNAARGGADFAQLAQSASQDEAGRKRGGDLGPVTRGKKGEAWDKVAFGLARGQVGLARTAKGFYLIKVEDIQETEPLPDAEARKQAREKLIERKSRETGQGRGQAAAGGDRPGGLSGSNPKEQADFAGNAPVHPNRPHSGAGRGQGFQPGGLHPQTPGGGAGGGPPGICGHAGHGTASRADSSFRTGQGEGAPGGHPGGGPEIGGAGGRQTPESPAPGGTPDQGRGPGGPAPQRQRLFHPGPGLPAAAPGRTPDQRGFYAVAKTALSGQTHILAGEILPFGFEKPASAHPGGVPERTGSLRVQGFGGKAAGAPRVLVQGRVAAGPGQQDGAGGFITSPATSVSAVRTATHRALMARERLLADYPEWENWRRQARAAKTALVELWPEYLALLREQVESWGGEVFFAQDADRANDFILQVARRHRVANVVQSKSMTAHEIGLPPFLARQGIQLTETDLGEFIIQLAGHPPAHLTAPALHLNRFQIAGILSAHLKLEAPGDPAALTRLASDYLAGRYAQADMGITGVNFAAAREGVLVCFENEGNLRLSATLPQVHLALMGWDKMIPGLADMEPFLRLLPASATGQRLTSLVHFFKGLKSGPQGTQAFYLVILDNGRSRLAAHPELKEALYCLRCGACLNICPVFQVKGAHLYGRVYPGAIGALLAPFVPPVGDISDLCSQCGSCATICPAAIELPKKIRYLRRTAPAFRRIRSATRAAGEVLRRPRLYRSLESPARAWLRGFGRGQVRGLLGSDLPRESFFHQHKQLRPKTPGATILPGRSRQSPTARPRPFPQSRLGPSHRKSPSRNHRSRRRTAGPRRGPACSALRAPRPWPAIWGRRPGGRSGSKTTPGSSPWPGNWPNWGWRLKWPGKKARRPWTPRSPWDSGSSRSRAP
jgi:L-lactate dehydrogenase complex protein LldF